MGHFEFSICDQRISSSMSDPTSCLQRWRLQRVDPSESYSDCKPNDARGDCQPLDQAHPERWYLPPGGGRHSMRFRIPANLECAECTLQWRWWSANSCVPKDGYGCFFDRLDAAGWTSDNWHGYFSGHPCGSSPGNPGCGEQFANCVDIKVSSNGGSPLPTPPLIPTPNPTGPSPHPSPPPAPTPPTIPMPPAPTPHPPVDGCVALWGKCGGQGWTGPSCCAGSRCEPQDRWYHQCVLGALPETEMPEPEAEEEAEEEGEEGQSEAESEEDHGDSPSPAPVHQVPVTPSPTPARETGECVSLWGKCGGKGWSGPSCCVDGSYCHAQTEWYHQCVLVSLRGRRANRHRSMMLVEVSRGAARKGGVADDDDLPDVNRATREVEL